MRSGLKCILTYEKIEISFLDVMIYKNGNHLDTDLYMECTDSDQLLFYMGFHSDTLFKSLPWNPGAKWLWRERLSLIHW